MTITYLTGENDAMKKSLLSLVLQLFVYWYGNEGLVYDYQPRQYQQPRPHTYWIRVQPITPQYGYYYRYDEYHRQYNDFGR
jgi:hypothetical protein